MRGVYRATHLVRDIRAEHSRGLSAKGRGSGRDCEEGVQKAAVRSVFPSPPERAGEGLTSALIGHTITTPQDLALSP